MSAESEAAYEIPLPEELRVAVTHSRVSEALFAEMEAMARAEVEAARLMGAVESAFPSFGPQADRDGWFEACFGCSERELIEANNAAAVRYVELAGPWRKRRRRRVARQEALEAYVRARCRLRVAHGLTTVWR